MSTSAHSALEVLYSMRYLLTYFTYPFSVLHLNVIMQARYDIEKNGS